MRRRLAIKRKTPAAAISRAENDRKANGKLAIRRQLSFLLISAEAG